MSRLVRKKIAVVCMVTLTVIYFSGIFAAWVSPYSYEAQDYSVIRTPPSVDTSNGLTGFWSNSHLAGTDRAGRDLFTRVLWGVQNTVLLTVVAMLTGALPIGVSLGLMSGYFGGKVDSLIMRAGEIAAVFPEFFLVIIIASTMGPRIRNWVIWLEDNSGIVDYLIVAAALVVLVAFGLPRLLGRRILPLRADNIVILLALVTFGWFGIALLGDSQVVSLDGLVTSGAVDYVVISVALVSFGWIGLARLVRGQILYLKGFQHVEAARAVGASTPRIMFLHLLPNAISPIVVNVSMGMGVFIGTEIFLSWIGLGIQPPRPSLGRMLLEAGNIGTLQNEPWMLLAPGFVAWLLVLSWNLLGDALNDVLNPRTR